MEEAVPRDSTGLPALHWAEPSLPDAIQHLHAVRADLPAARSLGRRQAEQIEHRFDTDTILRNLLAILA